jgi:hypothetical protein
VVLTQWQRMIQVWWAMTAYQGMNHARQRATELLPQVLQSTRVVNAVAAHAEEMNITVAAAENTAAQILKVRR